MILASTLSNALPFAVVLAYVAWAWGQPRLSAGHSRWVLLVVALLHLTVLHRDFTADPPTFGFALALSVTMWWVFCIYALESRLHTQGVLRWAVALLSGGAVWLAASWPGTIHPNLSSSWLPLHWALGLSAYGMFGAAVVHAWMMTRTERHIRMGQDADSGLPLLTLEKLTFRFVTAGFMLLTATLVAGALFGENLYGQGRGQWRWDHKTIFALLSWLTFATLLIGRSQWGWRGRRAVRVLYIGASLLLLSYAGSRFVLEILLGRAG